jgi:hypothetical protein
MSAVMSDEKTPSQGHNEIDQLLSPDIVKERITEAASEWVELGLVLDWKPSQARILVTSITINGHEKIPPTGTVDPKAPFPAPPPLSLGWVKRNTEAKIEWHGRVFDEVVGLAAFVKAHGADKWTRLEPIATALKVGDAFDGKATFTP